MRALFSILFALAIALPARSEINPATDQPEKGISGKTLTGQPLREPDWPESTRRRLEMDLEIAKAVFDVAPQREDSWIWLGRRYGYLGWYADAIDVFTAGLERFPDSYKLHRFRGRHRARNRDFEGAIDDYRAGIEKMQGQADTYEPDGIPNARRQPISTYRSNLHYYLGQTSFATADYEIMLVELDRSLESPIALDIDDHRIAVAFWKYLALRKLGRDAEASMLLQALPPKPVLIENETYHRAIRVFSEPDAEARAARSGDSLARFALGMKHVFAGRLDDARRVLEAVVEANALGYWPAEAELTRAPLR
ncbi:MAG: tetratricopeptide repeat protein [Woeseiaceae bacterium]|nr:tetratricopeptide repeat protein [Woeseiaceae bacterium]